MHVHELVQSSRWPGSRGTLTYSKAAKSELSRDYDGAFRLYVKSAELYLHLSRTESDNVPLKAAKWKASAAKALERAEKIKAFLDKRKTLNPHDATSVASASTTLTPVGIDHFSARASILFCISRSVRCELVRFTQRSNHSCSRKVVQSTDYTFLYGINLCLRSHKFTTSSSFFIV
ncbi:hypothetical protein C0992_010990 [Termitomyces sp. T32_za158]|nr:hypothetical protein C0992_010990 [Termitomyces sp. T32_za158]